MAPPGCCRHGVAYELNYHNCEVCRRHRNYWAWRNAGGVPRKKTKATMPTTSTPGNQTAAADPPGRKT